MPTFWVENILKSELSSYAALEQVNKNSELLKRTQSMAVDNNSIRTTKKNNFAISMPSSEKTEKINGLSQALIER